MNQVKANSNLYQTTQFRVLNDSQCAEIFEAALRTLERTGCKVGHERAREILKKAGAHVDGQLVRIPASLVERALQTAPRIVNIYDTEGELAMSIGAHTGRSYWGPGVTNMNILDRHTNERRPALYQDVYEAGLVSGALDNYSLTAGLAMISDRKQEVAELYEERALLEATTKPQSCSQYSTLNIQGQIDMFAAVMGSEEKFLASPCALFNSPPISPLFHPEDILDRLLYMAEKGVPCVNAVTVMMGGTGPATMAGSLVIALADIFTGLVLTQLVRPGVSFLAGACVVGFDMQTMSPSISGADVALGEAAVMDLLRYLGLPFMSNLGGTDSPIFDQQAAADQMLQIMTGTLSGAGLNMFSGFLETGMSGALESLVMVNEMIDIARYFTGGVQVDAETLAEDVIHEVGPMNQFIAEEHTIDHYKERWMPNIYFRAGYDAWEKGGKKDMRTRCIERVDEIIEKGPKKKRDPELLKDLDRIVQHYEELA